MLGMRTVGIHSTGLYVLKSLSYVRRYSSVFFIKKFLYLVSLSWSDSIIRLKKSSSAWAAEKASLVRVFFSIRSVPMAASFVHMSS